jgi:hypothetical protein
LPELNVELPSRRPAPYQPFHDEAVAH